MVAGIFGNNFQSGKETLIKRVFGQLDSLGIQIFIENEFYHYLAQEWNYSPMVSGIIEKENLENLDFALSIGGDGTFLRTAEIISGKNIPILGINTGHLGFLADVSPVEVEDTLNEIFKNHYFIEERTMLQITRPGNREPTFALNEIVIQKRDTSSMIKIMVTINEEYLTTYWADGLIVATPTGSTAYSISVNGPILVPDSRNFVLSPIAPHSLNVRPLVITDDAQLSLHVEARSPNFLIAADGRSETYPSGTRFDIRKASRHLKVIKRHNHTFYKTLREKLMWGADNRI